MMCTFLSLFCLENLEGFSFFGGTFSWDAGRGVEETFCFQHGILDSLSILLCFCNVEMSLFQKRDSGLRKSKKETYGDCPIPCATSIGVDSQGFLLGSAAIRSFALAQE